MGDYAGYMPVTSDHDYYSFAAWQSEDVTVFGERVVATLNHNGSATDDFQISRSASTNYSYIYWNGSRLTTDNVQFWNTRRLDMGGEIATNIGTSGQFNMQAKAITTGGGQVSLPNPQDPTVDNSSLNGSRPSDSHWNWRVRP